MAEKLKVLILEDVSGDAELMEAQLRYVGFELTSERVETRADFLDALERLHPDVVLADYTLPQFDGMSALALMRERAPHTPVIMVTGSLNEETAVECIRAGAADYVLKTHLTRLGSAVQAALASERERELRRRAERALKESEEHFRSVAESASDAIVTADTEGRITYWNGAATTMFGHAPEEAVGQPLTMLMPTRLRSARQTGLSRFLSTHEPRILGSPGEQVGLRKDGTEFPIEISLSQSRLGESEHFSAIIRDVSERKTAEQVLQASEQRFRDLFEFAPDALYLNDLTGRFVDGNRMAEKLIGYDRDELIGKSFLSLDLLSPWQIPRAAGLLAKAVAGKTTGPSDFVLKHKDGTHVSVEIRSIPVRIDGRRLVLGCARDVTERRDSEAWVRLQSHALEAAAHAIMITDRDGVINWTNDAFTRLTGYSSDEATGQNPRILNSGRQDQEFYRQMWDTILAGEVWRGEIVNRRKDGALYIEEGSITPVRDLEGEITHFVGIKQDISERKAAEQLVKRLSHHNELILNSAAEGLLGMDQEGNATFANPAATELIGRPLSDVLGKPVHELLHHSRLDGTSLPPEECRLLSVLRDGSVQSGEDEAFWRADGSSFPVKYTSSPIEESGQIVGAVVVFEDITERRQAETALRESEASYRDLVENATYGIYRSSVDGQFLNVNRALVDMLGYGSRAELLATPVAALFRDPAERDEMLERVRTADLHGGLLVHWKRRDGTPLTVMLAGRHIRDAVGKLQGFEVIAEDVTERRVLEDQLRQAQKMEAVGQLTGGIAHDFNNILGVVIIEAQLGMMGSGEDNPLHEHFSEIKQAGDRAAELTAQLLAFSRKQVVEPSVLNINRVISGMSTMLSRLISEEIELSIELAETLGNVLADKGQMEQIVANLVVNARDAMPGGGQLTIRTLMMTPTVAFRRRHPGLQAEALVVLEIQDSGCGIPDEVKEKMFDPFYSTKAPGRGSGLGLSTVYGILQKAGGGIEVDSTVDVGTTIRLYFPLVEDAETEAEEEEGVSRSRGSETVMVVEDDPRLRRAAVKLLERDGYTVVSCEDGLAALGRLQSSDDPVHLILTDVIMPNMGGREMVERARELRPGIKALFMSGYTDDEVLDSQIAARGISFLPKPFEAHSLALAVRSVIDEEGSR